MTFFIVLAAFLVFALLAAVIVLLIRGEAARYQAARDYVSRGSDTVDLSVAAARGELRLNDRQVASPERSQR